MKSEPDIIMRMKAEMEARAEAKDSIKYPLNEFPNYDIVDIVTMLRKYRNKKLQIDS